MASTARHHHHQLQEDNWEEDFTTTNNTPIHHIFQRNKGRGIFPMDHEKELTLACERYQYPAQHFYLEDDDTASSVTSASILSASYSELDLALNDIDDFMYDEPPPTTFHSPLTMKTMLPLSSTTSSRSSVVSVQQQQQFDYSQYSGVVKRLVGRSTSSSLRYGSGVPERQQEIQDNDDWADDVDVPKEGLLLNSVAKVYDQLLLPLDYDEFEQEAQQQQPITINKTSPTAALIQPRTNNRPSATPTIATSSSSRHTISNFYHYGPERDEDDEDMTGLEFPNNMNILPKRLDEKKKYNPLLDPQSQAPVASTSTTRIPVSTNKLAKSNSKFLSLRENDDDDFCEGLNIKDTKAFSIAVSPLASSSPRSKIAQQKLLKGKEQANFVSRLARPSPLLNNGNKQSDHAVALAKKASFSSLSHQQRQRQQQQQQQHQQHRIQTPPTSTTTTNNKHTFLAGTKASRQREADIASTIDQQPAERKSANGYTLIARPKTKVTSYCTQLDNIDNLNDLRPSTNRGFNAAKRSIFSTTAASNQQKVQHPKCESKSDPDRPWRRNMQTTASSSRSKVKLIQPNEQNLKKEYNDMRYDDSTHCWQGNETSLLGFQQENSSKPTYRRPMLIMNKHQQKNQPSRYAAVVGSSMIFNTDSQKWVSANQGEECNELDTIEDLKDELLNPVADARSASRGGNMYYNNSHAAANNNNKQQPAEDDKLLDFKLSIEVKRQMMFEQEQHETWMSNWWPSLHY